MHFCRKLPPAHPVSVIIVFKYAFLFEQVSDLKRDLEMLAQKEEGSRSEVTAILAGRSSLLEELKVSTFPVC